MDRQANPYVTITDAINSASTLSGDIVMVAPGTYTENVTFAWGSVSKIVHLRSSQGPVVTEIQGGVAFGGGSVRGFTISSACGVSTFASTLSHCIVRNPGPMAWARRDLVRRRSITDNCVITGFQHAFVMFSYATYPGPITNTIAHGNGSLLYNGGEIANFVNCCLPQVPVGFSITAVNTVVGDPHFWDAAHGDFHLAPGSPCIDAGVGFDPNGTIADIGAIPYDAGYATGPTTYCSTTPTSDGCLPTVTGSGLCSMSSAAPFLVTATQVSPNKLGRLLYSLGEANIPFQGGVLCLAPPVHRTPPSNSGSNGLPPPLDGCSGVLSYDFNAFVQSGADPLLLPGRIVRAQYRFRDPHSPGGYGIGLSDALRFGIAP